MSHNALWRAIQPVLNKGGWHAIRVENPALPGTPDVNWACARGEGWIELKFVRRWPPKGGVVQVRDFTNQQRVWLSRRARAGGRAHVLLQVGTDWLLFRAEHAVLWLGRAEKEKLCDAAVASWARMDVEQLKTELLR